MKFRTIENLTEGGLARVWKHIQDKTTFAIIGSQDKDTKEDRRDELISMVKSLANKDSKIGYRPLFGSYQYEDGTIGQELSLMIYNISKEKALDIMNELNQESIIWKDESFFGFLTADGIPDGTFKTTPDNMNFSDDDIKLYGSVLYKHKNKNALQPFKFVMEQYVPVERNAVRNMAGKHNKEVLFEMNLT